jgi:hypothetical protein
MLLGDLSWVIEPKDREKKITNLRTKIETKFMFINICNI